MSYTTKELSKQTWPDFERLFSQKNGWDHCWCMHFHRPRRLPKAQWLRTRAERGKRNQQEKLGLVEKGCAHGILVYSKREPVGWCQYGPKEDLPRIDSSRKYRGLCPEGARCGLSAASKIPDSKFQTRNPCAPQKILGVVVQKLWRIACFVTLKEHRGRGVASTALKAALQAIKNKGGGLVEAYPITHWKSYAFGNESTHGTAET